jgi:hypothetical protein
MQAGDMAMEEACESRSERAIAVRVRAGQPLEGPPLAPEGVVTLDGPDEDPERWDGLS